MRVGASRPGLGLWGGLLALGIGAGGFALPALAQRPTKNEMDEAMREMRRALENPTPEQRKVLQGGQRHLELERWRKRRCQRQFRSIGLLTMLPEERNAMSIAHTTLLRASCAVLFGGAVVFSAAAQTKGEHWEYTLTMEMDGMKMPLPPSEVCVRPDEGHVAPMDKHCQLKERKVSGATTTFRIVCGPPEPGELKGSFTRKGGRVEGRYTIQQGTDTMTVVADGRRLGVCDPAKPSLPTAKKS